MSKKEVKDVKPKANVASKSKPEPKKVVKDVKAKVEDEVVFSAVIADDSNRSKFGVAKAAVTKLLKEGKLYYSSKRQKDGKYKVDVKLKK